MEGFGLTTLLLSLSLKYYATFPQENSLGESCVGESCVVAVKGTMIMRVIIKLRQPRNGSSIR